MKKYYIGLIILGLLTLGLTGYAVFQAAGSKQDNETERKAQEIADKLNNYTYTKGVPQSLSDIGVKDIPQTISYTKKSDESYEFCVTYKHESKGYSAGGVEQILTGSIQRQLYGASMYDYDDSAYYDDTSYTPSSLYLPYTHKAGKVCRTVKIYNYNQNYYNYNDPYSGYNDEGTICDAGVCNNNKTSSDDTERQTDIKALHSQLEAYFAVNGSYPTLANVNDSQWRATNMKGLDKEALRDPKGTGYTLVDKATKNTYDYIVSSDSGKACDNKTADICTIYSLQATLDDGTLYTKLSLN